MPWLKKYGTGTTIYFPLVDAGAVDFESTPVTHASGDTQISKDGGVFANTSNAFTHEGNGVYSLTLTATEMQAANIVVTVIDQTATKEWEDQSIIVQTYGNASADMAFDLGTASTAQTGDTYALANGAAGFVAIDTVVDAIKAKTDSLTFTTANQVDANIQYVNDVLVTGVGTDADPWGQD